MAQSKHSHTGHRSSKTGRFVTERYAKRQPSTTQKESIPNPRRGGAGKIGGEVAFLSGPPAISRRGFRAASTTADRSK